MKVSRKNKKESGLFKRLTSFTSTSSVLVALMLSACTKPRDPGFGPDNGDESQVIFALDDLKSSDYSITTAIDQDRSTSKTSVNKIVDSKLPEKLSKLFVGKSLIGKASPSYKIKFTVQQKAVIAQRIVQNEDELNGIEKDTSFKRSDSLIEAPLMFIPVVGYGIVKKQLNDQGEATAKLELVGTSFEKATHVKLNLIENNISSPTLANSDSDYIAMFQARELLGGKIFELTTGNSSNTKTSTGWSPQLLSSIKMVPVVSSNLPARFSDSLKNFNIIGKESTTYQVLMDISASTLSLYKIVESNELTSFEKALSKVDAQGRTLVRIASVPITQLGKLEFKKIFNTDDSKELSSEIVISPSTLSEVNALKLNLKNTDFGIDSSAENIRDQKLDTLFDLNQIHHHVDTLVNLKETLNLQLTTRGTDQNSLFVTSITGGTTITSEISIYKLVKRSELKDAQLEAKLKAGGSVEIKICPQDILSQIPDSGLKSECVMIQEFEFQAKRVVVEITKDREDKETSGIAVKPSDTKLSKIVMIESETKVDPLGERAASELNPYNTIRVSDIKDKEFLFRRTLEDNSSSIQAFGPGASGDLLIVKFGIENNRLVVRNVVPVNGDKNPTAIDQEVVMSIPVTYLARDLTNNGVYRPVNAQSAELIQLDWTNNTLPLSSISPIGFMGEGQCFMSTGSQIVSNMDNRIKDGSLNFTINGTYTFQPDCMSFYNMRDYWWMGGIQTTFNIKERVSFKLHNQKLDKLAIDLPFNAQVLMDFGLFTAGQLAPDEFGNSGTVDTLKAHPVIHDFSGDNVLVYNLGGLPDSGWMRESLILGTKEVVADWNKTLAFSFRGTSLARPSSKPYIILKVDGLTADEAKKYDVLADTVGHLGDLDRNYIWNFEKNLDSGLLGLSQAGPNPHSGRIEQNNVLMYGGNLWAYVDYNLKSDAAQKEYQAIKDQILQEGKEQAEKGGITIGDAPVDGEVVGNDAGDTGKADDSKSKDGSSDAGNDPKQVTENLSSIAQGNFMPIMKKSLKNASAISGMKQALIDMKGLGKEQGGISAIREARDKNDQDGRRYLEKIFRKAISANVTHDPDSLQAIAATEILKAYGNKLSADQRLSLSKQSRLLAMKASFNKNFANGSRASCVYTAQNLSASSLGESAEGLTKEQVFKLMYKSTLAHEVGHSLGLTHNFKGSYDKTNFAFNGEDPNDKKARNYSSIMDYIPDDRIHYQGPGPYDARAIRVGYTGLIELEPSLGAQLAGKTIPVKTPIGERMVSINKTGEIKLEDYKAIILGNDSWWRLDGAKMAAVPLKKYGFCTDIHVGDGPLCNRWDLGTTPQEVSQFWMNDYKNSYPLLNSRGKFKIDLKGLDSYIGRVFFNLFNMRPFLEETFYLATSGAPQEEWIPQAIGALNSMQGYLEILGTPTVVANFNDFDKRMSPYVYDYTPVDEKGEPVTDKDGKPVIRHGITLVEKKAIQDIRTTGLSAYTDTRGIEFDKAIALMMLTERSFGIPKYEANSLHLSFAEFEKYLLGATTPDKSQLLQTLKSILADDVTSVVRTPHGMKSLPPAFKSETSEIVRYYSLVASNIFLNADTIEDKFNFAATFRTKSSNRFAPTDRPVVSKLDQDLANNQTLKLFADNGASIASDLTKNAAQKRILLDNNEDLQKKMLPILSKTIDLAAANEELKNCKEDAQCKDTVNQKIVALTTEISKNRSELISKLTVLNKKNLLLSADQIKAGMTFDKLVDAVNKQVVSTAAMTIKFAEAIAKEEVTDAELALMENIKAINEKNSKAIALRGIGQKTVLKYFVEKRKLEEEKRKQEKSEEPVDTTPEETVEKLGSSEVLESNHGIVVNNLQMANRFYIMMSPEAIKE